MTTQANILFCDNDSIYKQLDCNVYDINRDALTCNSSLACVYHPPCRSWGRLRHFSGFHPGEHLLSVWSILRIWKYGGILEHPAGSKLWNLLSLPLPGKSYDLHKGFSVSINQSWFGHKCTKNTWLYICGINISELPSMPLNFNLITHSISSKKSNSGLIEIRKKDRSKTPVELANYLISTINIINNKKKLS